MFVGACLPVTDVRPFVSDETGHLKRPTWPNISLPTQPKIARERDFVRGCGPAEHRRRGGPDRWPGEHAYVKSDHLVRFVGELGGAASDPLLRGARCTFRRLFCAPPARARFEVGLRLQESVVGAQPIDTVLAAVGGIPLRVNPRNVNGTVDSEHVPLVGAGSSVAKLFARATTSRKLVGEPKSWWVVPAAPLFVVETGNPVAAEQLRSIGAVQRPEAPAGTTLLHVYEEAVGAHVWLIAHDSGVVTTDPELRHLRIHLVRLHEERETLKYVLQLMAREQLTVAGDSDEAQELDSYLTDAAKSFERDSFHGIGIDGTLRVAYGAEALVSDADWASLRAALEQSRRQLTRAIERVVQADRDRQPIQPTTQVQNFFGSVTMTDDHSINIGGEGAVTLTGVNIAQGQQIQQSLSNVKTSGASDEIKSTMEAIHNELVKLLPQLPAEDAEKATASFDRLSKAATEPKPDRKWWEVSASGLLEAANAVADAGKPLVGLLGKLFGLAG
jgi:hypothetical protein